MKRNFSCVLALTALILTAGCQKSIKSSVDVSGSAKALTTTSENEALWQTPSRWGRVTRFDLGDGNGSDCLLAYDLSSGGVQLTKIGSSGTFTSIYSGTGFTYYKTSDGTSGTLSVTTDNSDITDNYYENGGVHILPYDAWGTGHEDHILVYIPGRGILYLLHYDNTVSGGPWVMDWSSTSGIGGYDLLGSSKNDRIITYDYGTGYKNSLVCYRPGEGYTWVIKNTGISAPIFTAVVKSSSGIGGYDMKDVKDQLVAIGHNSGAMDLVAYRPSTGALWYITHAAYSTSFTSQYNAKIGGFTYFDFKDTADRLIAFNQSGGAEPIASNLLYCYRPGSGGISGTNIAYVYGVSGTVASGGLPYSGLNHTFSYKPYDGAVYHIGDHVLAFNGGNVYGNSTLIYYSNGGGNQSQIYTLDPQHSTYTQIY